MIVFRQHCKFRYRAFLRPTLTHQVAQRTLTRYPTHQLARRRPGHDLSLPVGPASWAPPAVQKAIGRNFYSTVVIHSRPQQRIRRFLKALAISTVSFAIGAYLGLHFTPPFLVPLLMSSVPSDSETLSLYSAPNDDCREIDQYMASCPLAKELRTHPDFQESRPHLKSPAAIRSHSLTGGTLAGPGKIVVPPYVWAEKEGRALVSIFYIGDQVSGHPGVVHGGLLATMLDEGLARCCFPALPNKIGFTARLQINYQQPTNANQYLVLKARTTKVEGRKAYVEGHIETMPADGEEPTVLASADALFVEPRGAALLRGLHKTT